MNLKYITRTLLLMIVVACMMAASFQPMFASADSTLTGTVSCSACRGMHMRPRTPGLACTVFCVSHGAHYTFIVGGKTYLLEGSQNLLEKVAGGKATLNGHIEGDTFELTSIVPHKHTISDWF